MQIISRTVQANILSLVCQVVTVSLMKLDVGFYFSTSLLSLPESAGIQPSYIYQ